MRPPLPKPSVAAAVVRAPGPVGKGGRETPVCDKTFREMDPPA